MMNSNVAVKNKVQRACVKLRIRRLGKVHINAAYLMTATCSVLLLASSHVVAASSPWSEMGGYGLIGDIIFTTDGAQLTTHITLTSFFIYCSADCSGLVRQGNFFGIPGFPVTASSTYHLQGKAGLVPYNTVAFACSGSGSMTIMNSYANSHTYNSPCMIVSTLSGQLTTIDGPFAMTT